MGVGRRAARGHTALLWGQWLLLLAALVLLTVTEVYRPFVAWGLGMLTFSFALYWARTWRRSLRTGLELPWVLFILSAYVGLWAAPDRSLALLKFARILAVVVLYYQAIDSDERVLLWGAVGFVALAMFLAVYWPTQHDFIGEPAKFRAIAVVGWWINTNMFHLPGPSIQSNVAGGVLSMAIPFAVGLALYFEHKRNYGLMLAGVMCALVLSGGLLLTSNRGGWLSVGATAGVLGLVAAQRRWFACGRGKVWFWGVLAGGMLLVCGAVAASGGLGRVPDPFGSLQGRLDLWRDSLALIRDYLFTGCGLGAFPMVYSAYGILIHVPFLTHIHNTFLEIWIEQGVLGALALLWMGGVALIWAWRALSSARVSLWGQVGLAALCVVVLHGVFDCAFYVTRTLPLLGLGLGYAGAAVRHVEPGAWRLGPRLRRALGWSAGAVLLVGAGLGHRQLLGAWYANLGAAAQAQAELGVYDPDHFGDLTLDRVRQTVGLERAEMAFGQALRWDAGNVTARQRLGMIAASRGEDEAAWAWLQPLWDGGRRDDVTRLLVGDVLAARGEVEAAAAAVRGLPWAGDRLMWQAWYRYWTNEDYARTVYACAAVLGLSPQNKQAADLRARAEARLGR